MMYNNRVITLVISIFFSCAACAEPIDSVQAQRIVSEFLNKSSAAKSTNKAMQQKPLRLAKASRGYYAFNVGEKNGFVLVASDDSYPCEVLAYSDEGTFDTENIPDNAKWWLSQYDDDVLNTPNAPAKSKEMRKATANTRTNIPYLISTRWDQGMPYYMMCPTMTNESGQKQHCLTGCTATSLAQVLNFHKWPVKGTGTDSNGYSYEHVYDWDNMLDTYGYYYDDNDTYHDGVSYWADEVNAVARLMRDCGAACEVDYGLESTGGWCEDAIDVMINNWGYSPNVRALARQNFSSEEWLDILHEELANRRPILYNGENETNGYRHAFLCDGYQDGYIHMNWGWSGHANGYYCLGNFNRYDRPIPDHGIIIGIEPALGTEIVTPQSILKVGSLTYTNTDESLTMTLISLGNKGTRTESGNLGVKVKHENGDIYYYNSYVKITLNPGSSYSYYGKKDIKINYAEVLPTDGVYEITPAFLSADGKWFDVLWDKYPVSLENDYIEPIIHCFKVTKSGSNVTVSTTNSIISATINNNNTKFQYGSRMTITGEVSADLGDFNAYIMAAVFSGSRASLLNANKYAVKLQKGEKTTFTLTLTAPNSIGSYKVAIFDNDLNFISELKTVEIVANLAKDIIAYPPIIPNYKEVKNGDNVKAMVMPINQTALGTQIYFRAFNEDQEEIDGTEIYKSYNNKAPSLPENIYTEISVGYARSRNTSNDREESGTIYKSAIFNRPDLTSSATVRISDFAYFRTSGDKTTTFTMSAAGWSTLMLPFDHEIPDGLTFYEIDGNNGSKLRLVTATSIAANTPYLVNGIQGDYTFSGTPMGDVIPSYTKNVMTGAMYTHYIHGDNVYVLQKKAQSGLGFYRVGEEDMKIPIYRCYLTAEPGTNVSFFPLDIVTCIDRTDANADKKTAIFNTMGTRMNGDNLKMMPKGVYIVNGKKVVVK